MPAAYPRLETLFSRLANIDQALAVLGWDMATMMPDGAAEGRANQMATLKALAHELLTGPEVASLLDAAAGEGLNDWQAANLGEMRRDYYHAASVPTDLVEQLALASSASEMAWRKARPAADFAGVVEPLSHLFALTREMAEIKGQSLGLSPYDALLDQYEPGGRSAEIDLLFDDLAAFLPGFLADVLARQAPATPLPAGPFAPDAQKALGLALMQALGFDFDHGRLDVSRHPFCGGTPDDVRITTRYDESDFLKSLMSVLHETGHALYERGLPAAWRIQPVGRARGMSVHESQSLLVEMQVCRSQPFFDFVAPVIADKLGLVGLDADLLAAAATRVKPDFIRVDADEVTYPAHVILRYRLEKALVAGDLAVADIPAAWNEGMEGLLGIRPPDDRLGCLQDIHWYDGAIGYFPTYTLGAMTAAQLFDAASRALPGLEGDLRAGNFSPLLGWLRANIHGQASHLPTPELLRRATGRSLDASIFKAHLRQRYLS